MSAFLEVNGTRFQRKQGSITLLPPASVKLDLYCKNYRFIGERLMTSQRFSAVSWACR